MQHYGQTITWGTQNAPHLFSGICTGYSYRDALTHQLIPDELGEHAAMALHSRKAEIQFEARVTKDSTNFLDLSGGAAITITGVSSGVVLVTRAVESWSLGQPKMAAVTATHFPEMALGGGSAVNAELDAFTPTPTDTIVTPGQTIVYGTHGLSMNAVGVVHRLSIEQHLSITEDDPSPDGRIVGAASHGYLRTIQLDLLATGGIPEVGSVLDIMGAPGHAADYKIARAEVKFSEQRGKMYSISAIWIPAFTA